MQNHKRNKFVPLTVEAEDNQTVYALAKIKELEEERDALRQALTKEVESRVAYWKASRYEVMALESHVEQMRSALQAIDDLSYSRGVTMEKPHWSLRVPGQSDAIQVVKEVLDSTPKQSLAAIKVKTLRDLAKQALPGERADIEPWLLEKAEQIEKEGA